MPAVFDVADYFLAKNDPAEGDRITHLRLQKLVYFAQGFALAILCRPLFEELIYAWEHGPVCLALYNKYKRFGREPLDVIPGGKREAAQKLKAARRPFNPEEIEVMDEVFSVYGRYTAAGLRQISHATDPWLNAPQKGIISHEAMKKFFTTQIVAN